MILTKRYSTFSSIGITKIKRCWVGRINNLIRLSLTFSLLFAGVVANADDNYNPTNPYYQSPQYFSTWAFNNRAAEILKRDHKTIFPDSQYFTEPAAPVSGGFKSTRAPVTSRNKPTASTINKLVAFFPTVPRDEAKHLFNALYKAYGQIEKTLGIPRYDVAGALAAIIAANYQAYNNVILSDADFKALFNQAKQALRSSRGFAKLNPSKKRTLYEQLAIMSTFTLAVQLSLQQQPNPTFLANFQEASRLNLEGLLNVSADRVIINSSGLVIN